MNARNAFIKMIKEENFYNDTHQSLRKRRGTTDFHDETINGRWHDFRAGFDACLRAEKGLDQ